MFFIHLKFVYCPLTWMFHNRELNYRINRLHEKCVRIVYRGTTSSFEKLQKIGNSVSINYRNIPVSTIEMLRVYTGISLKDYDRCHPTKPTFKL